MRARVLWIRYLFIAKAHGASFYATSKTYKIVDVDVCNVCGWH